MKEKILLWLVRLLMPKGYHVHRDGGRRKKFGDTLSENAARNMSAPVIEKKDVYGNFS